MDAEVGVIGIGTMGSMALWQLAKRRVSVIGFEQFGLGHDRSAAGGETRIFRTAYSESPEYVPLLQEARHLWSELEKETDRRLLTITGGLTIGDPNVEFVQNVVKSVEEFHLDHEILSQEEMKKRYPQHRLLPNDITILDKQSGFLRPEYAIVTAAQRAMELGATIHKYSQIESIKQQGDHVVIKSKDKEFKVRKLLVTPGPWAGELLPEFSQSVKVRRIISTWFPVKDPQLFSPDRFPIFRRKIDNYSFYGIPSVDGSMVKVVLHGGADDEIEGTHAIKREVEIERNKKISQIVKDYLPALLPDPSRVNVYMEGFTSDKNYIIGKVPGQENMTVLCGFSGHGFKMAPVMGKIAADLVIDGKTKFDIERFSPLRFAKEGAK